MDKAYLNREKLQKIAIMIDANLLQEKHYKLWAKKISSEVEENQNWISTLLLAKDKKRVVNVINDYVYNGPENRISETMIGDEYVACVFLRYKRNEISWANFLDAIGEYAYESTIHQRSEYFYEMLQELQENEYSKQIEKIQVARIESEFFQTISVIKELYVNFKNFTS